MGVIFGVAKKDATGWGGSEGVAFFGRKFSRLSFLNTSLRRNMPSGSIIGLQLKLAIALRCTNHLQSKVLLNNFFYLDMKIKISKTKQPKLFKLS